MLKATKFCTRIVIISMLLSFQGHAQQAEGTVTISRNDALKIYDNEQKMKLWLEALVEPGVVVADGKMIFSKEAQKLIGNSAYRAAVFKDNYSFLDVQQSLSSLDLQKAYWQMINMYPQNKEHILRYVYAYDKIVPTDEIVTAAFYTYAFFDPNITSIKDGKPNVYRPDLFEEYLRRTKEIVAYIKYFRENEKETK